MDPRIQEIMNQLNKKPSEDEVASEPTPSPPKPPTNYEEYLAYEGLVCA